MDLAAFNDPATKLDVFTCTTGVDVCMSRENHDMVVTSCNRDDFFVTRQSKNGCASKLRRGVKQSVCGS